LAKQTELTFRWHQETLFWCVAGVATENLPESGAIAQKAAIMFIYLTGLSIFKRLIFGRLVRNSLGLLVQTLFHRARMAGLLAL
jgi:hypothetical protein